MGKLWLTIFCKPAPTPSSTPAPEMSLAEQIALSDARNAMLKASRKEIAKERLSGLSVTHGVRAPTQLS